MVSMGRKKISGKHSSPRKAVQIPADWLRIAQELAAARPMPAMWLVVELIKREAEAQGMKNLPPVPWAIPKDEDTSKK
jgi:hypothetical protein